MKRKRFFLWVAVLITAVLTGLLLLWVDGTRVQASTTQPRITAVVVTDTDKMIWDAVGINVGDDMYPDVAYNSQDDEFLVVFEWEDTGGGSGRDLASVRVDSNGQALGWPYSPQGVAISGLYTDTHPVVAYNPTNNTYLAVWERSPGSDGAKDIWGVVLSSGGAASGTEFYIANWSGDQRYPDVAYSAAVGRYLVVWEDDYGGFAEPPDVYGASLDGSGSDRQFLYISGSTPGNQMHPAVAANDANGRWLVMWSDSRDYGTTGYDVYGQQVQFSGALVSLWGSQVHIGDFWGSASAPDVAWGQIGTGDGEFLTVWSENNLIYGQRVQANSTLVGDVITVSTDYGSSKNYPALAFDSADEAWWVVWADNRDYG